MKKRDREDAFTRGPSAASRAGDLDFIPWLELADFMIELDDDGGLIQLGHGGRSGELLSVIDPFHRDQRAFGQTFLEVLLAVHSISLAALYKEFTTLQPTLT